MSVKVTDYKHSIEVHLYGVGECVVAFDIIEEDDHGGPMVDFAVFCEDKPVTYDLDKRQYNYCEHKAYIEMEDILTDWKQDWEENFYDQGRDDREFAYGRSL